MIYLLDTHTFLWFINDDNALSATAKAIIEDPESIIYPSIASLWEIAIKVSLGSTVAIRRIHRGTIARKLHPPLTNQNRVHRGSGNVAFSSS